jgi:hypothetical protein
MKNGKIRHYQSRRHYLNSMQGMFANQYQKRDHSDKLRTKAKTKTKNRIKHKGVGKVSSVKKERCNYCRKENLPLDKGECKGCKEEFKDYAKKRPVYVWHPMEGYNRVEYGEGHLSDEEISWLLHQGYSIHSIDGKKPYYLHSYKDVTQKRPTKFLKDAAEKLYPKERFFDSYHDDNKIFRFAMLAETEEEAEKYKKSIEDQFRALGTPHVVAILYSPRKRAIPVSHELGGVEARENVLEYGNWGLFHAPERR